MPGKQHYRITKRTVSVRPDFGFKAEHRECQEVLVNGVVDFRTVLGQERTDRYVEWISNHLRRKFRAVVEVGGDR